jgi:hypothetical protein
MANSYNYGNSQQPLCPTTDKSTSTNAPFYRAKVVIFPRAKPLAASDRRGKRPTAYAPGFGVAGAHLSRHRSPRRPKKERPAPNFQ